MPPDENPRWHRIAGGYEVARRALVHAAGHRLSGVQPASRSGLSASIPRGRHGGIRLPSSGHSRRTPSMRPNLSRCRCRGTIRGFANTGLKRPLPFLCEALLGIGPARKVVRRPESRRARADPLVKATAEDFASNEGPAAVCTGLQQPFTGTPFSAIKDTALAELKAVAGILMGRRQRTRTL